MLGSRLSSLFRGGSIGGGLDAKVLKTEVFPTLKLQTDKQVYRPGDPIFVTIEISNPHGAGNGDSALSLLVERLSFEIKGIEKLDTQWFATQKPLSGSKQRRGEHVFLEGSAPVLVSNQIVSARATKSYVVRAMLPSIIPPSYKGVTIRYLYYVRSAIYGQWLRLGDAYSHGESVKDISELEARIPLQIWVTQKNSGLLTAECQSNGIVPSTTILMDLFWKDTDGDSDWVRTNDIYDGIEEGYESPRDEISSVSSFNQPRESMNKTFGSSLSLQSYGARSPFKDATYYEGERASLSSNLQIPRLSVAEVLYDPAVDISSLHKSSAIDSPSEQQRPRKQFPAYDEKNASPSRVAATKETLASEGFIRGRSYNIWTDDHILLRLAELLHSSMRKELEDASRFQ